MIFLCSTAHAGWVHRNLKQCIIESLSQWENGTTHDNLKKMMLIRCCTGKGVQFVCQSYILTEVVCVVLYIVVPYRVHPFRKVVL